MPTRLQFHHFVTGPEIFSDNVFAYIYFIFQTRFDKIISIDSKL